LTWQPNMPDSSFDVTRFENRNGVISWRVSGWLHGLRVRKNFKSREEAGAELAALEAKAAQAAGNVRGTSTFLADDQLREAEAITDAITECRGFEDSRGGTFFDSIDEAKAGVPRGAATAPQPTATS